MKKWILKAIVQKTISYFPNANQVNFLFQKYITKGVNLTEAYLEDRLIHFSNHERLLTDEFSGSLKDKHVLELGTGWYPIIPICLFLSGAEKVTTVDISTYVNEERLFTALEAVLKYERQGKLQQYLRHIDPDRKAQLEQIKMGQQPIEAILATLQINYIVEDARALPFPDQSVDYIVSNNTFEHIYPEVLKGILTEFKRVLKPKGRMSHFIDMSDHFAHLDQSITIYNFLKYEDRTWQFIDNDIQPQNRWRINHYRALYKELGIDILKEENRPGRLEEVRGLDIAPPFNALSAEDLAISHSYLLSGSQPQD
jgi:SAM-dependent methyltransferase